MSVAVLDIFDQSAVFANNVVMVFDADHQFIVSMRVAQVHFTNEAREGECLESTIDGGQIERGGELPCHLRDTEWFSGRSEHLQNSHSPGSGFVPPLAEESVVGRRSDCIHCV